MIRVYDEAGNVVEAHEHKGEFKERSWATSAFTWAFGLVQEEYYLVPQCHHLWRLLLASGHEL